MEHLGRLDNPVKKPTTALPIYSVAKMAHVVKKATVEHKGMASPVVPIKVPKATSHSFVANS